jgi:magnesium-transporting ATPase (P-type)
VYRYFGYAHFLALPHADWAPFVGQLATEAGRVYVLATTVFHAGVVTAQIGNAFACRTEKEYVRRMGWLSNRSLILGIGVEVLLILLMIYFPPLAWVFEHLPLPPNWWAGLLLFAPALYVLEWIRKNIVRGVERLR